MDIKSTVPFQMEKKYENKPERSQDQQGVKLQKKKKKSVYTAGRLNEALAEIRIITDSNHGKFMVMEGWPFGLSEERFSKIKFQKFKVKRFRILPQQMI